MRIDHVAIAVINLEQAMENFKKVLKIDNMKIEEVSNEKVKVAILNLEDTRIELMEPTSEASPIMKFLNERAEGLHHIAITADSIEQDTERALLNGVKTLGGIRSGSYGRKITFIHPKSMNGVLTELCEAVPVASEHHV